MANLTLGQEGEVTWFIVVNDEYHGPAVELRELGVRLNAVELNNELTVLVPLLIVNDGNAHFFLCFTFFKDKGLFGLGNSMIVLAFLGTLVDGADTYGSLSGSLIENFDAHCATCLRDSVLERLKAEEGIPLLY